MTVYLCYSLELGIGRQLGLLGTSHAAVLKENPPNTMFLPAE